MAVRDGVSYYPTERLISKKGRKHYRIPVRSQHWQLRSLISAESSEAVYFPGGQRSTHVQRLNTKANECETVKLLSFPPRCLVAANGWVCCGGETGEFSAIHVDETGEPIESDRRLDLDPDTRLPLDLEYFRNETTPSSLLQAQTRRLNSRLNKGLEAKSVKLARDRVNCVTLWFPPAEGVQIEGIYNEPVAVLANNDKTVVIVSLRDFEIKNKPEPLDVITYPDYVNRAVLSPDGRMLIAILDDPYLYIHMRADKNVDDRNSVQDSEEASYQWEEYRRILLKSQKKGDQSDSRGSFAACFSRSSSYLAIGTQYGTISIFAAPKLHDLNSDPLVTTLETSRPLTSAGAVRDMAFCPGPFDILAWTEDRGRVGLADIRTGFVHQQTLDISATGDYEHLSILDRNTIDPRLLEGRGEGSEQYSTPGLSSGLSLSDFRRRRAEATERSDGLSPEETAVLDALQAERRRREQSDRITSRLADLGGSSSSATPQNPWEGRPPRSAEGAGEDNNGRGSRERSSSISRALRELDRERGEDRNNITHALTEWLRDSRERGQERMRTIQRLAQDNGERRAVRPPPRRHIAVRMSDSSPPSRTAGGLRANTSGSSAAQTSGGGWADLEALYNISLESNLSNLRSGDDEAEAREQVEREYSSIVPIINSVSIREMDSRLSRRDDRLLRQRVVPDYGVHESPPEPDNTAGISWSRDGRVLFVGAENGIYEFHVDIQGRKFCPGVTMR